jgi:hypothetical protein
MEKSKVVGYNFHETLFNPLYWHLLLLLRNENIRFIYIEGGSSAAKTYTVCQALSVDGFENEYSTMSFRRFQVNILDSVYSSFKSAIKGLEMDDYYQFQQHLIKGKTINPESVSEVLTMKRISRVLKISMLFTITSGHSLQKIIGRNREKG